MNLRYKKIVSKLNIENGFLMKTKIELEKKNEELKKNFEICQIKSDFLEKENLDLKMKLEDLLNEKQNTLNDSFNSKITKCAHCKFHGHSMCRHLILPGLNKGGAHFPTHFYFILFNLKV
ncbi:hypothetical protein PTKIN_Ptkin02bG0090200 [Pterospermum kingtungense]